MGSNLSCEYDVREISIDQLHILIHSDFQGQQLVLRPRFKLIPEYVKWLQKGIKTTTIRYRPGAIDVPCSLTLPLIETPPVGKELQGSELEEYTVGTVQITNLIVKPFGLLNKHDAIRDGFSSVEELKAAFQSLYTPIYGHIRDSALVSIYTISLIQIKG